MNKFSSILWKGRFVFLGIFVLALMYLAPFALRVKPNNSVDALNVQTDTGPALIQKIEKIFGSEEFIAIFFKAPDIFSTQSLQAVEKLTKHFEARDEVESVLSLTKLWKMETGADESLRIEPYINPDWMSIGVPSEKRNELLSNPIYQGLVYNKEGTFVVSFVMLKSVGKNEEKRSVILNHTRDYLKNLQKETGYDFKIMGIPVIERTIYQTAEYEQKILTMVMIGVIWVLLYVVYRNLFISLVPVLMLSSVFIIVLGTLGVKGISLNWITSIAPVNIMIASIYEVIHVVNAFRGLNPGLSPSQKMGVIYRTIFLPCLFTSLTTLDGFISLISVPVKPISQFGTLVGFGILTSFILTFTFMILLLNCGPKTIYREEKESEIGWIHFLIKKIQPVVKGHPRLIMGFCFLLALAGLNGVFRLDADQGAFDVFKKDTYGLIEASHFMQENGAGGGAESYLYLESEEEGAFLEPKNLRYLETMSNRLPLEVKEVSKVISIVDLVKYGNQALHQNDPAFYKIPDTKKEVAEILFTLEMQKDQVSLAQLITGDYKKVRMRVFGQMISGAKLVVGLYEKAGKILKETIPENTPIKAEFTGRPLITARMILSLPKASIQSVLISGFVIMVMMILVFKSIKVGVIAMIPNIVTIIIVMGFLPYIGVKLNVATAMAFSVAIGMTVDNTIHLVWNIKKYTNEGFQPMEASLKAMKHVGQSSIVSSAVLIGGFLTFCFSAIWPTTQFGLIVGGCILLALLSTLFLTPALFGYFGVIKPSFKQ